MSESHCMDCGSRWGTLHRSDCATFERDPWIEGEERIDRIAQSDASGDHYTPQSAAALSTRQPETSPMDMPSKYHVRINGAWADVYDVLQAFGVTNPADAHAIKKMLMPGKRGVKDGIQDRREAIQSLHRAIELEVGE